MLVGLERALNRSVDHLRAGQQDRGHLVSMCRVRVAADGVPGIGQDRLETHRLAEHASDGASTPGCVTAAAIRAAAEKASTRGRTVAVRFLVLIACVQLAPQVRSAEGCEPDGV